MTIRELHQPGSTSRRRGQSLVEFALILPVLMLMLLIAIDFGRLFFSYVTLTNVTRIAANYGSVDPASFTGTPAVTTYNSVVAKELGGLNCALRADAGGFNPPIPVVPVSPTLGSMSVATMTCDFKMVTPLLGAILGGGSIPITVSSEFPIRTGAITNIGGGTTLPPPGSPVAAFSFTGVSGGTVNGFGNVVGTVPVTVNVVNASINAQTYDWDWGDGSHDFTASPPAHSYNVANTYTVVLTVTNPSNPTGVQTSHTVSVAPVSGPAPVAGFYGTPVGSPPASDGGGSTGAAITGSAPLVVNFTNISTDGTAYSWEFGDGTSPNTATAPQHQYNSLGVYTVTLTVTAPTGGTPFTRTGYVTVGCVVPNFAGTATGTAGTTWTGAGFSGQIRYRSSGSNGNGNPNAPSGTHTIVSQTIAGGTFSTPVNQGGTYVCNDDIIVDYT